MHPAVRTRRQARSRLTVALHAIEDVVRAAERKNGHGRPVVPNGAVLHTAQARSHVRAAIQHLNGHDHEQSPADGK